MLQNYLIDKDFLHHLHGNGRVILWVNLRDECNTYCKRLFENTTLDCSKLYLSPLLAFTDTTLTSFRYKILTDVLFLKKTLHIFGKTNAVFC